MDDRPVWQLHGFKDQEDFDLIERATNCSRCRKRLAKYARWRLRNVDKTWSNSIVCSKCRDVVSAALGVDAMTHLELLPGTLF